MLKRTLILLFMCSRLMAQQPVKESSLVNWMSLTEAMEKQKVQPRPMIVDFYTDWCGWCKRMEATTYSDASLAQYINTYFYPVKFDAEGKDSLEYLGEIYKATSNAPRTPHPLAVKLLNNKLMYPTTLFLNGYDKEKKEFKTNMIASGYLETQKIEPILIFTVENVGHNATYDEFRDRFNEAFYDSTLQVKSKDLKWMTPKEIFGSADTNISRKKKTLVLIDPGWCNSCRVMRLTSFIDSSYKKYLYEKFDLVDFNTDITDTLYYKGNQYVNDKNPQLPFHQLAIVLQRNSISFPTLMILDEKLEIVDAIQLYIPPSFMDDIIHYYGDNFNKTKPWGEYMKLRKEKKAG